MSGGGKEDPSRSLQYLASRLIGLHDDFGAAETFKSIISNIDISSSSSSSSSKSNLVVAVLLVLFLLYDVDHGVVGFFGVNQGATGVFAIFV